MKKITFSLISSLFLVFTSYSQNYEYDWIVSNTGSFNTGERVVAIIEAKTLTDYVGCQLIGHVVDNNGNWGYSLPTVATFKLFVKFTNGFDYDLEQSQTTSNIKLGLKKINDQQVHLVADCSKTHTSMRVMFSKVQGGNSVNIEMGDPNILSNEGDVLIALPKKSCDPIDISGNIRLDLASDEIGGSKEISFNGSSANLRDNPSCRIKMRRVASGATGQIEFQTRYTDDFVTKTRLKITPDGKVAVGDHSPSAKLDVAGNIKAHEIEVTLAAMQDLQLNGTLTANNITYTANGNTADFVFEDNYHLKDLSEVEAFIKANRHLPEIPSAAEMEATGVNLAEMNKLLLMKVEELTLYSIELEKEVKRQKAEMEEVRSSESEVRKEMKKEVEGLELKVEELSDEKRAMRGEMEKMKEDRSRVTELEERLVRMESLLEELSNR